MKNIFFVILVLSIFSCERELTVDDSNFERSVVVNSILSSDSLLSVNLSYTSFFTDTDLRYAADSKVYITDLVTQEEFKLEYTGGGDYISDVVATKDHEYALSVITSDGIEMSSETCVPEDIMVDISIDTIYDSESYISELKIGVEISNDPDADNFYTFEVFPYQRRVIHSDSIKDGGQDYQGDFEDMESIKYEEDINSNVALKNLNLFSDKGLNGEDISTSFNLDSSDISFGDKDSNDGSGSSTESNDVIEYTQAYAIRIMAVSPELFNYMESYEIYNQQGVVNTSNSQPSNIAFNIENGIGVFGGSNIQIIPIN
jgi:hypothetical protein